MKVTQTCAVMSELVLKLHKVATEQKGREFFFFRRGEIIKLCDCGGRGVIFFFFLYIYIFCEWSGNHPYKL